MRQWSARYVAEGWPHGAAGMLSNVVCAVYQEDGWWTVTISKSTSSFNHGDGNRRCNDMALLYCVVIKPDCTQRV